MSPAEFTSFAEHLAVQRLALPAAMRSASSRAYYGAFHLTRQFLTELGLHPGTQHNLHLAFLACAHETTQAIARHLSDLQSNRIKSDYRLEFTFAEDPAFARRSVELAREIERLLTACRAEPLRSIVLAGMQGNPSG